jgi:mannose-1-phosphate guanylyltransferase
MNDQHAGRRWGHGEVQAVVLAGGMGTRLRPLTLTSPKPMLHTAGVPFLSHLLSRIAEIGVTRVVIGTSYKAEAFHDHFGDGSKLGLALTYVSESEPLGTGGGLRNAFESLDAPTVLVFNGDVLSGADLTALVHRHQEVEAEVTLLLSRVLDPRAYGCVVTDGDGKVQAFLEKTEAPPTDQINAGCYVFRREVIESIPAGRAVSIEREVFPGLVAKGKVYGHVDNGYWRDMGVPEDFVRGSADLVRGIAPSPVLDGQRGEALIPEGTSVAPGALVIGGTALGRGVEIGAGARLDGAVVFDGAKVEAGAVVERSILGFGVHVGPRALIRDAVVGDGAQIGARCELLSGARVWPGVALPDGGLRFSSDV